ncbi:MAG: hypothetical protein IJM57_10890 [Lachnospiraceae bacterium]|nr:hypothetical protein [Lachnospiraceae bacterium]
MMTSDNTSDDNTLSALTLVLLLVIAVLSVILFAACGKKNTSEENSSETPVSPTAAVTPTEVVAPTAEVTPTSGVTPTAEPTIVPTAGPTPEPTTEPMPEPTTVPTPMGIEDVDLPVASLERIRDRVNAEILSLSYAYVNEVTIAEESKYYIFDCFPSRRWKENGCTGITEYLDSEFNVLKQCFRLRDGKEATIYYTRFGYALDYPGQERDYILLYWAEPFTIGGETRELCVFESEVSSFGAYSCYSYDANGNRKVYAEYNSDNTLLEYTVYAYDDQGRLISERNKKMRPWDYNDIAHPYNETTYSYDDSGNLVRMATNDEKSTEHCYTFHKDAEGRLSGWSIETKEDGEPVRANTVWIKYFDNNTILTYSESDNNDSKSDTIKYCDVLLVNDEMYKKLLTVTDFRPSGVRIDVAMREAFDLTDYDADNQYFGLPMQQNESKMIDGIFYGDLPKTVLNMDSWDYSFPEKDDTFWYWCETRKDGLLTRDYGKEGDQISAEYEYDSEKRLVKEVYFDGYYSKIIVFTYDNSGNLIERVRTSESTNPNAIDVNDKTLEVTTYRYTYDKTGKLTGMTCLSERKENKNSSFLKMSEMVLTVYQNEN